MPFGKKTPCGRFQKCVPKKLTISQIHVLCANFVNFGRPKVGEIERYLLDKKKQKFGSLSRSRLCADRAQNLPGPAANNVLTVPQISPKSFTSSGVITERVNTVQTWHKVFPILGQAVASRRVGLTSPTKTVRNVYKIENCAFVWELSLLLNALRKNTVK